jgi:hypothetical protein
MGTAGPIDFLIEDLAGQRITHSMIFSIKDLGRRGAVIDWLETIPGFATGARRF